MFDRMNTPAKRRSIKEALLLLLSSIMAAAVTPLAIARLRDKQLTMAALDIGVVCIMLLLFLYVFVTRKTRGPGIVMALVFIAGAFMTTLLLGKEQIFWAYPALAAAFFLLDTRQAVVLSLGFASSVLAILWKDISIIEAGTIALTMLTTILLTWSFALTNRQQQAQLRQQVNIDPLTHAGNRRAQTEKLDTVNAIFRRTGSPCSLLILDVDYFKKVNDTHGHVIGDQVLVDTADLIRSHTRATESLYRYGGEEFVVIAEQTPLDAATQLAESLRQLIEHKTFSSGVRITVSIGVAEVHRGEGRQGWLNRADHALFNAKDGGRNRVFIAAPPPASMALVQASKTASA